MSYAPNGNLEIEVTKERLCAELSEARAALDASAAKHLEMKRLYQNHGTISDGVVTLQEVKEPMPCRSGFTALRCGGSRTS
jgi:hypothetical protein